METVFSIVSSALYWIGEKIGLSYNEVNIIFYFIIIPMIYMILMDILINEHYFKIGFTIIVTITLLITDSFKILSDQLFEGSVRFLEWFKILGWNYIVASVIICVVVPAIVFVILLFLVIRQRKGH